MTAEELKRRISYILSQVGQDEVIYTFPSVNPLRSASADFRAAPGEAEIANQKLLLLKILYGQCTPELKTQFVSILLGNLKPGNASFICHAVLAIGNLSNLKQILLCSSIEIAEGLWASLAHKLQMESHRFTEADLNLLEEVHRAADKRFSIGAPISSYQINWHLLSVKQQFERVRYLRLEKELSEGQNPEINTDKQELVSRLEALGFRKEIVSALAEFDKQFYSAGKPLEFKGCMDLLRTIYEEIIEDSAKATATKRGKMAPQYGKPFQPWCQYLVTEAIITTEEGELAQKLYNYLSNAATHQLGSEPEQARVTKNFVIELGLLIVGRVQAIK